MRNKRNSRNAEAPTLAIEHPRRSGQGPQGPAPAGGLEAVAQDAFGEVGKAMTEDLEELLDAFESYVVALTALDAGGIHAPNSAGILRKMVAEQKATIIERFKREQEPRPGSSAWWQKLP